MKILHINQQNTRGGAAKVANYLVESLNKKGIEAELWYFFKEGENRSYSKCIYPVLERYGKDYLVDELMKRVVYYHRFYFGDVSNPFFKDVIKKIYKWMPDIIHLHNLHGGWVDLNSIAELSKTTQIILTLHDEWIITGHCGATMDCLGWLSSCSDCPDLQRYVAIKHQIGKKLKARKERFLSVIAKNNGVLVTPSEWLKKRIINSGVWKGEEIVVIPNGIDTSKFLINVDKSHIREELALPVSGKIGFFAADGGSKSIFKDFLTLRKAIEMMVPHKGKNFTLIIAGDDIENKKITKINNIDIIKLGYLQEKELIKYYSAVDIFIYPSKSDVFPLVVVEAMAAGLPVISTQVGGIPELIVHEKTGILVPEQCPQHLLQALIDFLDNKKDYKQMGSLAKERIFSCFDLEHMVSSYLNVYCQNAKS
jgi:glycosyltransferase involved in cell wall biosynthesis